MQVDAGAAPKPRLRDHAQVAWVLVCSLGALIPLGLYLLVAPVLAPWLRARLRKRLQAAPHPPVDPAPIDAATWEGRTVFIVAGEPSGDRLAARIVEASRRRAPGVTFTGYGGPALEAAGVTLHRNLMEHAVIGAVAVAASLGYWWRLCAETLARLRSERPDLMLTIDFPGLNGRIARWARSRGIRTVHVVAPQLWAHQPWRVFRWRRAVDQILATFPFEAPLFAGNGIPTDYVGHPLFEAPQPPPRTPPVWPGQQGRIELWPGSRKRELRANAPMLIEAVRRIRDRMPEVSFVVRLAEDAHQAIFEEAAGPHDLALEFVTSAKDDDVPLLGALSCSGTATAQLAADLVPMVAFYRANPVKRFFAWLVITSPWILLPNVIAGRDVVPETLFTSPRAGSRIADTLLALVESDATWTAMRAELGVIRERLNVADVAERAARAALST